MPLCINLSESHEEAMPACHPAVSDLLGMRWFSEKAHTSTLSSSYKTLDVPRTSLRPSLPLRSHHNMFSYSSLLSSTVALFAASTALAIPTGNSTFRARAPGYRPCKTSSSPRAGFPVADEQRIASGVAAAADPPNPVVLQVNWLVLF